MINSRALVVIFFVFSVFIGLVTQLFTVQIGGHEGFSAKADRQQNKVYVIKAERGIIYDRNKEILAYTKDDVSLYADARMLKNKPKRSKKLANELAKVFGTNPDKYLKLIKRSKGNVCLEKKVPKDKSLLLSNLVIDGFYKSEDYTRVYPYANITSHILGYVDNECEGRGGFEKLHNDDLCGIDGELHVENDAIGKTVAINYDNSVASIPGKSFELTVDKVYQKILSTELQKGIEKYKGKSGIGILADPNTGEILALANIPDYDPRSYYRASDFTRRNRALTDTYEPGSTMKSIVLSMLLEKKLVNENNVINTENGKYRIRGALIRDTHKHEKLTVREVLEQSSNIGMVKLSDKIKDRDFYKGLRDFGFSNLTSIDLLGETKGSLKKPDRYSAISKAFISQGYEISVTPIQMVMAYSALINGGKLLQPYILKRIYNYEGEIEEEFGSVKIRRVLAEETSELIRNIMLGVVENGTGSKAQQENIYVGGKTGTAQKLIDGKYSNKKYNSSFIGFFPADNPQVICFILVDSPEIGKYGGQVAAPIFKNITQRIIETDFNIERKKDRIERNTLMDNLIADIEEYDESDDVVSFANVSNKGNEKRKSNSEKIIRSTMPNLKNKSLREAVATLSKLNIEYKISGSGKIVKQSIKQGTPIKSGMFCSIFCSSGIAGSK